MSLDKKRPPRFKWRSVKEFHLSRDGGGETTDKIILSYYAELFWMGSTPMGISRCLSAFHVSVIYVILVCSKKEMVWVYTTRIVAMM